LKPHPKRPCGLVGFLEESFLVAVRDRIRLQEKGDPIDPRNGLLEQFQPLADEFRGDEGEPCDIAARPRQATDEPVRYRIANSTEDNRDGLGRLAGG